VMQLTPIGASDCADDIDGLVRAALVCGCPSCRHAVEAWSLKERADRTFARARAELTKAKRLRLVFGGRAA
jgi:hypothetical protein